MHSPVGFRDVGVPTQPFPGRLNQRRGDDRLQGLWFTAPELPVDDPNYGTAALTTPWHDVGVQTHLYRGGWWDAAHILWDTFAAGGRLEDVACSDCGKDDADGAAGQAECGNLTMLATIPPRDSVTIPVMISWLFPHAVAWTDNVIVDTYAGRMFEDAWHVARYTQEHIERLTAQTRAFHGALFDSTLPSYVLDAVSSQASTIRTNTCVRLADGQFYGWEGCSDNAGCCQGTCMHVWNYEQALAFLFPALERSIRRNEFLNSIAPDGRVQFRCSMPANLRRGHYHACADGQMGAVIRAYRDWQLSGDDAFLREIWPNLKRALECAWTAPNGWDADKDGVMEGVQHNTYDIEFYGPNTMMGTLYLGALRAAEQMARYLGEDGKADEYRAVFESGRARIDETLWNGEYYVHDVRVIDNAEVPEHLRGPAIECEQACDCKKTLGPRTPAKLGFEVKYQYGDGCLSDHLLGQWACHVAGLGYVLDRERVRAAIESIFRHNFRAPIGAFSNVQRVYAINDDNGLLLCSWPRGNRPRLPFPYSDEVWTGIEYHVAAHLIYEGLIEPGLALVRAARDRHDGVKRNPWDEFECGHHYARAMSSWSLLLALSGFSYSAVQRRIRLAPRINLQRFRCFWSADSGWGTCEQRRARTRHTVSLQVRYGKLAVAALDVPLPEREAERQVKVVVKKDDTTLPTAVSLCDGEAEVRLQEATTIGAGQRLTISFAY